MYVSTEYKSVADLAANEAGKKGHVLVSGGIEIGGVDVPVTYRLQDVSGPTSGARKDIVGWFDGETVSAINRL